ncbi:histone-like nucleoid-structuring protein Lsr2 [Saccharopolyspora phatthalungensis]|uniref:Putative membrane protein n=1 Tax=Saccharopolyspora phatthalungensis TaxID=664693 RepID=A0A840QC94_9PSEU|nr:Lsr2 family protein [Saccharopolyspora phatthalungensis]MBB5157451.1 putative membrane protein [Saccharopolyspora phatthalungensis]
MAEKTMVEFVDDIDGSPAQQTITFALDGVTYEIDLNARHAQHLRSVLEHHTKHGRRKTARDAERAERRARETNNDLTAQIRAAAQRTRDHLTAQAAAQRTPRTDPGPAVQATMPAAAPRSTKEAKKPAPASELAPQFSSA